MKNDLFPETLLVAIADGHTYTDSLKIATHCHKLHKNVMQSIENLDCSPEFRGLNFQPATYLDRQKKPRPMYRVTQDGFAFLISGFSGKVAGRFKEDFIAAFRAMEAELAAHVAREAAALHRLRPLLAPVVAGTERGLRRAAIGATVNRSARSISYHRRVARDLGLLPATHQEPS